MELKDFLADEKQLVDDFGAWYETRRKKKLLTMIRPVEQWKELYEEFKQIYGTPEVNQCDSVENDSGGPVRAYQDRRYANG